MFKIHAKYDVETPESVSITLAIAPLYMRGYAWVLDTLIRFVVMFAIVQFVSMLGFNGFSNGILLIIFFINMWGYYILCEQIWRGSSPGKMAFKLAVVDDYGRPPSVGASIVRNLLRCVDMLPAWYGFAMMSGLFSDANKRIGDIAASTLVVYQKPAKYKSDKDDTIKETEVLPLRLPLRAEEQKVLIRYARYCSSASSSRAGELAGLLSDVFSEPDSSTLSRNLQKNANWLLGK